jgi:hypothetical protein
MLRKRSLLLVLPAALAGCASTAPPWSEVTGQRYNMAIEHRYPAILVSVGKENGWAAGTDMQVAPGLHTVVIQARSSRWFRRMDNRQFELNIEPCKRYYVNAQFPDNLSSDFAPVVDRVEPIAGCRGSA